MQLGTVFQGGTMAAMFAVLAIVGRAWIVGIPERLRAASESKTTAAAELAERYKAWRVEVHDLRSNLMVVAGKQDECGKQLAEAHSVNRHNQSQIHTMLFLIRLLIKELDRLAPESMIVQQAKVTLEQLGHDAPDPSKSTTLVAAELTVDAAKEAVKEIKHSEDGE